MTVETVPVDAPVAAQSSGARLASRVVPYVAAVLLALLVAAIVIWVLGYDPVKAMRAIVVTTPRTGFGFVQTLHKWVPLTLLAFAFVIPLISGRFNIGGEGQLLVGAIGATAVGLSWGGLPAPVLIPLVLIAAVLCGAIWAAIAAALMRRFGVNEILSTVLLNFVSFYLLDYIASEVWPDTSAGHPATIPIAEGAQLPAILTPPMHTGVLLAAVVSAALIFWGRRTGQGFRLRAVGLNEQAAKLHGVRTGRVAVGAMIVGGAVAGLAGGIEVAGVHHKLIEGMQSNYLLLGIIIGLIARGSLLAVPFVAFGIAWLEVGASAMQRQAQVPAELVLIVEGLILVFLLLSDVITARLRRRAS